MFSLLLTLTASCPVAAPPPLVERLPDRVGQLFIVGNRIASQSTILRHLPLFPGQKLTDGDKAAITRRLSGLRVLGIRANWSILDSDIAYKDVKIAVEETWLTWLLLGPRSRMDAFASGIASGGTDLATHCFGRDNSISRIAGNTCTFLEAVYNVAPTSTLSTVCAESPLLAIAVHLFIGLPESLSVMTPILGAPSK